MHFPGARFEFRVELTTDKKRVIGKFNDLHKFSFRIFSGNFQAGIFKLFAVGIIKFVAVAVAFTYFLRAVKLLC